MSVDYTFLEEKGIDTRLGLDYTGGPDKYVSALSRYYKNYETNRAKVEEFFGNEDMENYSIVVHALKSNSRMVGNTALADAFEKLELASREGDVETVRTDTAATLEQYGAFAELLKPIGEASVTPPADEISGEEARKVADELLRTLDDFDDEQSLFLAKKLSGYPFRPTQKELLSSAISLITDFSYDEAADLIRKIAAAIE